MWNVWYICKFLSYGVIKQNTKENENQHPASKISASLFSPFDMFIKMIQEAEDAV